MQAGVAGPALLPTLLYTLFSINPHSPMHFNTRPLSRLFQTLLSGLLLMGLVLTGLGCGGAGANGGDEDGDNEDDEDTTAPAAPSGLTADADDALVTLSWNAVDDANTYNVYRATSATDSASGSPLATDLTETRYADEGADNGTTYYYRVTAIDEAGNESDGSGEIASTPFTAPTELTGTSGNSEIELDWSAATGAANYSVYRSTSSTDGAAGDPLTTGVSQAAYTDTTAENGTKYYYRITSVNPEDEESDASEEVTKTPFSDPTRP